MTRISVRVSITGYAIVSVCVRVFASGMSHRRIAVLGHGIGLAIRSFRCIENSWRGFAESTLQLQ